MEHLVFIHYRCYVTLVAPWRKEQARLGAGLAKEHVRRLRGRLSWLLRAMSPQQSEHRHRQHRQRSRLRENVQVVQVGVNG